MALPESDLPAPPRGRGRNNRKTTAFQARLERLREWRRVRAAELALDPGVLFPQSTLEALAAAGPSSLDSPGDIPGLRAWRLALLRPDAPRLLS